MLVLVAAAVIIGFSAASAAVPDSLVAPSGASVTVHKFRPKDPWVARCEHDTCTGVILDSVKVPAQAGGHYTVVVTLTLDHAVSAGDAGLVSAAVGPKPTSNGTLLSPRTYQVVGTKTSTTTVQWTGQIIAGPGDTYVLVAAQARDQTGDERARARGTKGVLRVDLLPTPSVE